jgi:hypothetical protein
MVLRNTISRPAPQPALASYGVNQLLGSGLTNGITQYD